MAKRDRKERNYCWIINKKQEQKQKQKKWNEKLFLTDDDKGKHQFIHLTFLQLFIWFNNF